MASKWGIDSSPGNDRPARLSTTGGLPRPCPSHVLEQRRPFPEYCARQWIAVGAARWPGGRITRFPVIARAIAYSTISRWRSRRRDCAPPRSILSLHGTNNFPFRKRRSTVDVDLPDGTEDAAYFDALCKALPRVAAFGPRIVFYQSGVDGLRTDALGRLNLTLAGLKQRDTLVFETIQRLGVPVQTFTLAEAGLDCRRPC